MAGPLRRTWSGLGRKGKEAWRAGGLENERRKVGQLDSAQTGLRIEGIFLFYLVFQGFKLKLKFNLEFITKTLRSVPKLI